MAEPIVRLIYGSENRLRGSKAELDAAIADIMARSLRNNERAGITGALLFTGTDFTQVLEGARREVERTFERISQDLRHGGVVLIDLGEVPSRAFAAWSMALLDARGWSDGDTRTAASLGELAGEERPDRIIVEVLHRFLAHRAGA